VRKESKRRKKQREREREREGWTDGSLSKCYSLPSSKSTLCFESEKHRAPVLPLSVSHPSLSLFLHIPPFPPPRPVFPLAFSFCRLSSPSLDKGFERHCSQSLLFSCFIEFWQRLVKRLYTQNNAGLF